jgi:hypothetical protein
MIRKFYWRFGSETYINGLWEDKKLSVDKIADFAWEAEERN